MIFFASDWIGAALRVAIVVGVVFGGFVYFLIIGERRLSAFIQDRRGPNRVGPLGLLQGLADGIKLFFKEDIAPARAHRFLYFAAPCIAVFPAVLALATVPFGSRTIQGSPRPFVIADLDVGILFVISIASLGVFGIILGGWASNSKYPLLGSLRAAAQMISYEIPLALAILSVLLLAGSASLPEIVAQQAERTWFVLLCPIGFLLFVAAMFAETNRLPFDLPEGETEIVGYHTEYSGMKFAMFFMTEYANMFTISCIAVLLFFGGWELLPFLSWETFGRWIGADIYGNSYFWLAPTLWLAAKIFFFLFLFIWVRWTLPRFRYDQLMRLGWKRLIPLGILNLMVTLFVVMVGL